MCVSIYLHKYSQRSESCQEEGAEVIVRRMINEGMGKKSGLDQRGDGGIPVMEKRQQLISV